MTESYQMVGVPFETPDATLDTIKLNAAIGVDRMQIMIYQPYRGTALAELSLQHGFTEKGEVGSDFFSPSEVALDSMEQCQVLMFRDFFKPLVRYYQVLGKLPPSASKWATAASDRVLCSPTVARTLNAAHRPANYVFRNLQKLATSWRVARHSTTFGVNP